MKARQFVNAVTEGYSLSRIKLKNNLFYPSTAEAQAVAMAAAANNKNNATAAAPLLQKEDYDELPVRTTKLRLKPSSRQFYTDLKFLPFYGTRGGGEGKVLCVDRSGLAAVYDADVCTVELMPGLATSRAYGHPVSCSWSVTHADAADPTRPDALYVIDREGSSFHALVYGDPISPWNRHPCSVSPSELRQLAQFTYGARYAWHWRTLPTPPVEVIEDADSSFGRDNGDQSLYAKCYALLHGEEEEAGATICVSFSPRDSSGGRGGTYCFDTAASQEWTKAGDWTLPFCSRAHHVPELGDSLLFGLENQSPNRFCAMDVSGAIKKMTGTGRAPLLRHAWLEHADRPTEWHLTNNDVTYLGDGRFCIHRTFDIMEQCGYGDWDTVDTVVLLTGVEVVRAPGSPSRLRMVKRKSKRLDCAIESVL